MKNLIITIGAVVLLSVLNSFQLQCFEIMR